MTHFVESPPSGAYWVPTLKEVAFESANGVGTLLAWGASASAPNVDQFTVSLESGIADRIVCTVSRGPTPDLVSYRLKGVRSGDVLKIYRNMNFGIPDTDQDWVPYSPPVKVVLVKAELAMKLAPELQEGRTFEAKGGKKIYLSAYGVQQRDPPMSFDDWHASVKAALEKLDSNPVGQIVLKLIPDDLTIYADPATRLNASADILLTPDNFKGVYLPSSGVDEVLLHEFIHKCENLVEGYFDAPGWVFSGSDFLTINATNVYSGLLKRGLRKDHAAAEALPNEFFLDPKKHHDFFKKNYDIAWRSAPQLCEALRYASGLWNPFKYH